MFKNNMSYDPLPGKFWLLVNYRSSHNSRVRNHFKIISKNNQQFSPCIVLQEDGTMLRRLA